MKSHLFIYVFLLLAFIGCQNKKADEINKNIKFVSNYENFNSLNECLDSLKGKAVYIDVWATWCVSCREEFIHKPKLQKLLKSKNAEILYISIDRDKDEIKWKELIKSYDLEGHHIRANPKLLQNLMQIFDRQGSISIPWYILVNEDGNILKNHASHPSQMDELEKELNAL